MNILRQLIKAIIKEVEDKKSNKDLITEPDVQPEREEDATDEFSSAGAVAGYTLPLGASNSQTSLNKRGHIAGTGFGGAKPVKKKKPKK